MIENIKDWSKHIVPKQNKKSSNTVNYNNCEYSDTTDAIYIASVYDAGYIQHKRRKTFTDFALMNLPCEIGNDESENNKRTGTYWLRSRANFTSFNNDLRDQVCCVHSNGAFGYKNEANLCYGVCPSLNIKLPSEISKHTARDLINLGVIKYRAPQPTPSRILYGIIELGEYPKTKVSSDLKIKLEKMYNGGHLHNGLQCTGKLFTTNGKQESDEGFLSKQNPEFEYNGNRYCRVTVWNTSSNYKYEDGTPVPTTGEVEWVKVEPISFKINNSWNFFTYGTDTLELESEEIVLSGMPFYPYYDQPYNGVWQNSLLRAFLNSAKSDEMDGNPKLESPMKWDFRNSGFLYQALNTTREPTRNYIIPENEKEVCDYAFSGCVGIQKIIVPSHVTKIGKNAFSGCVNTQILFQPSNDKLKTSTESFEGTDFKFVYIAKDGQTLILSPTEDTSLNKEYIRRGFDLENSAKYFNSNYRENFIQLLRWKEEKKVKFMPPEYTIQTFPSSTMKKYFINNNNQRWGKLVKTLGFDTLNGLEKNNSLVALMKIYYALGGFSDNQGESEKAFDYVLQYVATTREPNATPSQIGAEIHSRFSKLNITGEYNPTFANFFMKYYHQNPDFMNFRLKDKDGFLMDNQDYLCLAHNSFDSIVKNYPNRVVFGNEERAMLSPRFVAEHSSRVEYENVDDGNELLAELAGKYGYDQEKFESMQEIFNSAKSIKNKSNITAGKSSGANGITFRILEKDDPLGFVIGDITNCCQHIGGAGEKCVEDGYMNPNAGFLVFEGPEVDDYGKPTERTIILGQAYVWYDPKTKTVCYDNIEIPTKIIAKLKKGDKHDNGLSSKSFIDTVIESAEAIMMSMRNNGIEVNKVTTGQGYNDLQVALETRFGSPEKNPSAKHRDYNGYSDATYAQYLIKIFDQSTGMYARQTRETANIVRADIHEIEENLANEFNI